MNKVVSGTTELKAGTEKLSIGASTLTSKYTEILGGIDKLKSGTVNLTTGIEQIIANLEAVKEQLLAEQTSSDAIAQAESLKQLQASNTKMLTKLETIFNNDEVRILNAKKAAVECNLTTETDEQKLGICLIKHGLTTEEISTLPYLLLIENNSTAITTLNAKLSSSVTTINTMIATLEEALEAAKDGSLGLTAGLDELKSGVTLLESGSKELSTGLNSALTGTTALEEGLTKINKEGINKLSSYTNTVSNYSSKVKSLVKLSKEYNGYQTSTAKNSTFIYKIKSLTK